MKKQTLLLMALLFLVVGAYPLSAQAQCQGWYSDPYLDGQHRHCAGQARLFLDVYDAADGHFLTTIRLGCWSCHTGANVNVSYPGYQALDVWVPAVDMHNGYNVRIDVYLCPLPTPTPTATATATATPTFTPTPSDTPTATPTATATPLANISVYAVNPANTPVPVSRIGKSRFNASGLTHIWYVQHASGYSDLAPDYDRFRYRGAYLQGYPDQVLLGVTPQPAGGQQREESGNLYYGWAHWTNGERSVVAVYATPTPTPSPTPTPTSTPVSPPPTPGPLPYVIPPTIRPFLHLRGHQPPYDPVHVDYLVDEDIYTYAQVYLHAVPSAEVVVPPQYCEWVADAWSCTPADAVLWEGYTFQGVEREGGHYPSPVGDVTKAYTSARHTFDRNPRLDDPDYAWPKEFLHLYFTLPGGSEPACPLSGADGPCIVYHDRAPGQETLETTLHLRATWTARALTTSFDLPVAYPVTLSATQWEQP